MTIRLHWTDGTRTTGVNAEDVILRWAKVQWHGVESMTQARQILTDRAYAWTGALVDEELPDDEFLVALEAAGMFTIERLDGAPPRG